MTEPDRPAAIRSARSRALARAGLLTLALATGGLVLVGAGAWIVRRDLAQDAATDWLARRGIEAELELETLELNRAVGRLRIGSEASPDVVVERVEIDYALTGPWNGQALGATPSRVRLVRPVMRARWADGRLRLGALDPLIEEFSRRPPQPDKRGPRITVDDGRLDLATGFGRLQAVGDAVVDDGKLLTLDARVPAARLSAKGFEAATRDSVVTARRTGDRLTLAVQGGVERLRSEAAMADDATVSLRAELPYPDLKARRGDGCVVAGFTASAGAAGFGGASLGGAKLTVRFDGTSRGWLEDFVLAGALTADGEAGRLKAAGVDASRATIGARASTFRLARTGEGLQWRATARADLTTAKARSGELEVDAASVSLRDATFMTGRGGAVSGDFRLGVRAGRVEQGDLRLADARGDFGGSARFGAEPSGVQLRGSMTAAGGGWTGLGPLTRDDPPDLAVWKRAFADAAFSAPSLEIGIGARPMVSLVRPLVVTPRRGGRITIAERGGSALLEDGRGAFDLAMSGGGLPQATVQVARYSTSSGGGAFRFDADTTVRAALDFGVARDATIETAGRLSIGSAGLGFAPTGCAAVSVARLELGENDIERVAAALCAANGPLVSVADGGWQVRGRARDGRAEAPFLEMRFSDAEATIDARGGGGPLTLAAVVHGARVTDTTEATRFYPVTIAGPAGLTGDVWTAELAIRRPETEPVVATASLRHDGVSEAGGVALRAEALTFAEGGLQPAQLTPLAGLLGEPVTGVADFAGRFDWTADGGSSGGLLTLRGLDFVSPLGPLAGLRGTVTLTSLAPLISATSQTLQASSVQSFAALGDTTVTFQLVDQVLTVEGGTAAVNGGTVVLDRFDVALEPGKTWEGKVTLAGVGLSPIVEASAFKDRLDLEARVSGPLPFIVGPDGVRFVNGRLTADAPGRLSIQRAALTDLSAEGATNVPVAPEAAAGGIQNFAYQALEHLAFDVLNAEVNSLPEGRLGVLFRIKGRHDPPNPQELRLTWMEVLQRRFLDKDLPLPGGTEVDLTLDTTLNLDQLLGDWRRINESRQGRSEPVQPRP